MFGTNPVQSIAGLGAAQRLAAQDAERKKNTSRTDQRHVEKTLDAVEIADALKKPKESPDQHGNQHPHPHHEADGQAPDTPPHIDVQA